MKATLEQIENSSYVPKAKDILRVSKSSYMTYKMCPRQYFWRYVADIPQSPPSEAMIRGVAIHNVMEKGLLEGYEAVEIAATENNVANPTPGPPAPSPLCLPSTRRWASLILSSAVPGISRRGMSITRGTRPS